MLETSAIETLYRGQFTLSAQLIKPNYFLPLLSSHGKFSWKKEQMVQFAPKNKSGCNNLFTFLWDNISSLCLYPWRDAFLLDTVNWIFAKSSSQLKLNFIMWTEHCQIIIIIKIIIKIIKISTMPPWAIIFYDAYKYIL